MNQVHDETAYAIRNAHKQLKHFLAETDSNIDKHERILGDYKRTRQTTAQTLARIESDAIALSIDLEGIR